MGPFFTIVAALFVAFLSSCADRAIQARLEAVDSLMWSAPDNAYRLIQAIDPDSLSTDGQQAYYGLLYTQAQYKCYVPLTSDSLIARSVFYYAGRDEYRYGLSLYYLGAVFQEKKFYGLAIEQYNRACAHLSEHHHPKIVALVHSTLGELYSKQRFQHEAEVSYATSKRLFQRVCDSTNLYYLQAKITGAEGETGGSAGANSLLGSVVIARLR